MRIEDIVHLHIPHDKKISKVKAASFHPTQQKIAVAFRSEVHVYDLVTGSKISHFSTETEITHLEHGYTQNCLVAASRNGSFHIWDLTNCTLEAFHLPLRPVDRRHVVCMDVSRKQPMLFYSKAKMTSVFGMPLYGDSKVQAEYPHRKLITSLCAHPIKPLLATASVDGQVKVWNTEAHSLRTSFEDDKKQRVAVTSMAFYAGMRPNLDLLVTGTQNGRIQVWELTYVANGAQITTSQKLIAKFVSDDWVSQIFFHAKLPTLVVLNNKGNLKFISVGDIVNTYVNIGAASNSMTGLLQPFDMIEPFYVPTQDSSQSIESNRKYMEYMLPLIGADMDKSTGMLAFFGKIFQLNNVHSNKAIKHASLYYKVYTTLDTNSPGGTLPMSEYFNTQLQVYTQENPNGEPNYDFPRGELIYMDVYSAMPYCTLMSYSLSYDNTTPVQTIKAATPAQGFHRCFRMQYNKNRDALLLFYERILSTGYKEADRYYFMKFNPGAKQPKDSDTSTLLQKGIDGGFLGESSNFIILDESGKLVTVFFENLSKEYSFTYRIARLFTSPIDANAILYFNSDSKALGYCNIQHGYQFNAEKVLRLRNEEIPLQVNWCSDELCAKNGLIGLITSLRVVILDKQLNILSSVESSLDKVYFFHSCLWVGNILLYNTSTGVFCLTPYPGIEKISICTLDYPNSILCAVLADRILFACQKKKKTEMYCRYVSIVEPLMLGIASIPAISISYEHRLQLMNIITERFDCRSVSEKSLQFLEKHGFSDLSSELIAESQYTFSWELRYKLAISSMNFSYAFDIIKAQFLSENSDDTFVPKPSQYYPFFVDLARLALDYGQVNVANKCFDVINDAWQLFRLFSVHDDKQGLKALANRCQKNPDQFAVYMACSTLLNQEIDLTPMHDEGDHNKREELGVYMTDWGIEIDQQQDRQFYLNRGIKGQMKFPSAFEEKQKPNNPLMDSAPSLDAPEIKESTMLLDLNDFSKWMGATQVEEAQPMDADIETGDGFGDGFGGNDNMMPSLDLPDKGKEDSDDEGSTITAPKVDDKREANNGVTAVAASSAPPSLSLPKKSDDEKTEINDSDEDSDKKPRINVVIRDKAIKSVDAGTLHSVASTLSLGAPPVSSRKRVDTKTEDDESSERTSKKDGEDSDEEANNEDNRTKKLISRIRIRENSIAKIENSQQLDVAASSLTLGLPAVGRRRPQANSASDSPPTVVTPIGSSTAQQENSTISPNVDLKPPQESSTSLKFPVPALQTPSLPHGDAPLESPHIDANVKIAKTIDPKEAMQTAMHQLERGMFKEAKSSVKDAIGTLARDNSQILKKTNLILCIRYKLLLNMLSKVKKLETQGNAAASIALLTILMSEIPDILLKHRVVCKKMTITKNINAKNFGIAAKYINDLLPQAPPQVKQDLEARLKMCQEASLSNADPTLEQIDGNTKFCWRSFQVIQGDQSYFTCTFCPATFVNAHEHHKCKYCTYGEVQKFEDYSFNTGEF